MFSSIARILPAVQSFLAFQQQADDTLSCLDPPSYPEHVDAIIFDLGDVLFTWSAPPASLPPTISANLLREILHSPSWHKYEKGNISESAMYSALSERYHVPAGDIKDAFQIARSTLESDSEMVRIIRELKALGFKLYVMSNISAPDYEYLRENVPMDWTLFDGVFISYITLSSQPTLPNDDAFCSAEAHLRKPEIGFFKNVLLDIRAEPSRVLFVDDKFNNVLSAQSTGMYGIVHSSSAETIRQLSNLCLNPVTRAQSWLQLNKGKMHSVYIFSPLLIVEATGDRSLTKSINIAGQTNFFVGAAVMTTDTFPNDLDTTSIGLLSSCAVSDSAAAHKVMDEMLQFKNEDGILQVYFDNKRPRIDPIVCTNVLTLFHRFGRGHQLKDTFAWVQDTLRHRAYTDGTPYYATAEAFLYFLGCLINESAEVRRRIGALFENRLKERFGLPGDALALAMRLLAAAYIDPSLRLLRTGPACMDAYCLRQLQSTDGSWAGGWLYKYGSSDIAIQNHGLTTALGLKALAVWNEGKSGGVY